MDSFQGKQLNAPNDVVVASDGAVWRTDPGYGGGPDGRPRLDTRGNVWCSMGWADPAEDGVRCYASDGDLIGKVHLPETAANLCFGGSKRNRLFICASASVYALYVDVQRGQRP